MRRRRPTTRRYCPPAAQRAYRGAFWAALPAGASSSGPAPGGKVGRGRGVGGAPGLAASGAPRPCCIRCTTALLHQVHLGAPARGAHRAPGWPGPLHLIPSVWQGAQSRRQAQNAVLWQVAAACLRCHVPALSTMKQVRTAFLSYFPGGMQAAPEWSSASGLAALALLERELAARFVGGAFTSNTPVADVRRAHLPVLLYWTSAQLRSQAVKPAVARRHPEMVACLSSGPA